MVPSGVRARAKTLPSQSKGSGPELSPTSPQAISLDQLKAEARRCRTPKQFGKLLTHLRTVIPYDSFAVIWGHPMRTIRFMFQQGIPTDLIRWRLTTGTLWTSPAFKEWIETNRPFLWCDAAKRLKAHFDPELLARMEKAGLQYMLCGGSASRENFVLLAAAMSSEKSARAHQKQFESLAPFLVQASQRAYPRALLTERETAILERRARGEITKQIAAAERISERTVREHFQSIKKKLYTDDVINAVVIAVQSGMVLPSWKKSTRREARRLNSVV